VKVGFTAIDEDQWIGLAVIAGEIQLLEPRWPVIVVLAGAHLGARGRRAVGGEGGDGFGIGLDRKLQRLEGGGEGLDRGLEVVGVAHVGCTRRDRRCRG
jgi:hypothetical protein